MTTETKIPIIQRYTVSGDIAYPVHEDHTAAIQAVLQSPEVRAWKKDAERYRWLRANSNVWGRIEMGHNETYPERMDSTIDAAMEGKE